MVDTAICRHFAKPCAPCHKIDESLTPANPMSARHQRRTSLHFWKPTLCIRLGILAEPQFTSHRRTLSSSLRHAHRKTCTMLGLSRECCKIGVDTALTSGLNKVLDHFLEGYWCCLSGDLMSCCPITVCNLCRNELFSTSHMQCNSDSFLLGNPG